jgi:hypothetical protein
LGSSVSVGSTVLFPGVRVRVGFTVASPVGVRVTRPGRGVRVVAGSSAVGSLPPLHAARRAIDRRRRTIGMMRETRFIRD